MNERGRGFARVSEGLSRSGVGRFDGSSRPDGHGAAAAMCPGIIGDSGKGLLAADRDIAVCMAFGHLSLACNDRDTIE